MYKAEQNLEWENKVLLLMIDDNDDDEKYHYFAVKSKLQLYSFEWLRNKKDEDNCFQNALNDSLDYRRIKKTHKEYQNLSHILISITGKT